MIVDPRTNPYLRDPNANPYYTAPAPVYVQPGDQSIPPPAATSPVYAPPDVPQYGEFAKGLRRGAQSFAPTIDRTQAAVQGALGFENAARANLAEARRAEQRVEQNPDLRARVGQFSDIRSLSDVGDWAASSLGENLPLLGTMAATGVAGGIVGGLAGAGRAVGLASGMIPYLGTAVSDVSNRLMSDPDARGSFQEKSLGALLGGGVATAVGAVPFARMASVATKPAASLLGRVGKTMVTGGVTEGATEGIEEAVNKFTHQQFSPDNPDAQLNTKKAWLDYLNNSAAGFALGAVTGAAGGVVGGATVRHPQIMGIASRHPEGWQGFAKEHSAILDEQDKLNLARYSAQQAPEPVPDTAFGRKLQEIQERDALDVVYQDLLGVPRKEFLAQRQQRQATLDRLGQQFFFQGQLDPKDPEAAKLMQATPEWESILDSYAEDKKDDWLRERLGASAEQSALSEFEPEERRQLGLLLGLADGVKDPRISAVYRQLANENPDLYRRYEGILSNASRTARAPQEDAPTGPKTTLDPSAGRSERALGQQAEADYDTEGFGSDLAFADQRQLNPGFSEQETSSDYRLARGGKPWRSLKTALRDNPEQPRALFEEEKRRIWERQAVEELPTEAQEAYRELYAPQAAFEKKWRDAAKVGELTPEQQAQQQAEKAVVAEQVQANLGAWREARDTERNPEDEWGQQLNNTDIRPVPLRRMIEDEYGLDPRRVPEDRQELERIVIRDYLGRADAKTQERYADDPVAYAEDYEVLNKPKAPAVISGRDELTPTRRELVPPGRPRDRAAIAEKEIALLDTLDAQREGDYDAYKHFTKDELGVIYKSIGLEGEEAKAHYEANKDVLDRAAKARDTFTALSTEARGLKEDLRALKRTGAAVIVDRPNDRRKPGQPVSDFSRKRIPIEQYNVILKKWVKKSIDPMQLVIQEMSQKKNFSAAPDTFVDEVAAAFESGLAGILSNKSLGVRLDTEALPTKERVRVQSSEQGPSVQFPQDIQIDPETIIYSRKGGGLQLRWKDLEVKGSERMKRILGGLQERYKQAPSAEAKEAITATAGSVKQDLRQTVEGANYIAAREEQLATKRLANDPAALNTELARIGQQRKDDLRAIGAQRGKEQWLSDQDGSAVQEMGDGLETTAGEAQPLPLNQSNKWVDDMAREAGPYAPDKKAPLATQEPTRWAPKPLGVKKIAAFTDAQGKYHPAREIPNGYEVSNKGDKRFSQFNARLKDGRNIDTAFKQALPALRQEILQRETKAEAERVARQQEIARKKGQDPATIQPRKIVERNLEPKEVYPVYKALWQQWAAENPEQVEELRTKAAGRPLTDQFLGKGGISPARALAEILDETAPKGVTESQYAALPGQKARPNAPRGLTQSQLEEQVPVKPAKAAPTLSVVEMPTSSYEGRTQHNARQADVTAAFAINNESTGERQTARAAGDKLVQWDGGKLSGFAQAVTSKLQERQGTSLNIAGNGLVRWAERGYDQEKVTKAMFSILRKVKEDHPALERVVTGGQTGSDIAGAIAARALGLTVEVNMPKGFKQLVPGGRLGKTVYRTQAEVESYIENEAAKLLAKPQEAMANPPQSPQREFEVYGQSPDTIGPPVMPKPSANLRPEAPSRSAGDMSTADLKRAAGVPAGVPKHGVFDDDLAPDRPTSAPPAPVTPLPMTPQRQVTQARAQAAPVRIDPERVRAEAVATPEVPEFTQPEAPRPEYQPLLENYQAALAARETARNEVLPNLNRPEKERLRANTRLFQAGQQVKQLRQQFIEEYGQDPEQLTAQEQSQLDETGAVQGQAATALYQTENPPNAQTRLPPAVSPNVGMARPDPRAVPGQTRLSLKEQPAPDPRIGDRRPAPGYQASGQIPFNTPGVKSDGLRPQEVQQQTPTDAETAPVAATQSVAAPAAAAQSQTLTPATKSAPSKMSIPMNYDVNSVQVGQRGKGAFRPELKAKGVETTIDAIKAGLRTATTRRDRPNVQVGDIVTFTSKHSKEPVRVRVTTAPYRVNDAEEWSRLEGWTPDYLEQNPDLKRGWQFQYELETKPAPTATDVKYQDLGTETPDPNPDADYATQLADLTQREQALPKGQAQREADLATRVLKSLGVNAKVRMAPAAEAFASGRNASKLHTARGMTWRDADGTRAVHLNPKLSAEARIEVLGHELGHIIYKDTYQAASAETKAAIEQAFTTWRDQHGRGRVQDVMTSKKGVLTINDYFGSDTDFNTKSVEEMNEQDRNYLLDFEEWFADQTSRWLVTDAKPMGLVEQFFHDLANRIRDLLKQLRPNAPDAEVAKFLNEMFARNAPQAQAQAKPKASAKPKAKGPTPSPTAQAAQATAINPFGVQAWQGFRNLLKQLKPEEYNILGQAFRAAPVQAQLRKRLANNPVAYDRIRNPDDAIAYGFQFWQAGDIKLGPRANSLFQRTWNRLNDALGQVTDQTQAEALLQAYQQGRLERRAQGLDNFSIASQLSDTAVQRGYQKLAKTTRPLLEMLRKVAFTGHAQMTALENPHVDRLAELIYNEVGTEGVAQGMLAARTQEMGRFTDRLHTIFDGKDQALGEQVLDVLTKRTPADKAAPAVQQTAAKVYQLLQEIYQYTRDAGVQLPSRGEVITLAGKKVNNYFPRQLDVDYLQQHSDEFIKMLQQAKYEKWVNGEGGARGILGAYIQNFGDEGTIEFDPDAEIGAPQAGAFKKREFDWIEDADLAPFLSRDLGQGMATYIHQAVKRVEFLRRFGNGKYAKLLEQAREAGLKPEQEERVTKYMQGVMGTLGMDINPTLNTVQGWILVAENWMILALSTVTSLTDVVGLAVRGDFDTAWQGLRAGMREVVALAKQDKTELRELAEAIGTIEQHTAIEALGFAYGGYQITGLARRLNEALFKYNLMQGWTRGTRLMGLATAKAFVAKHGQRQGNATSQRFLDQLGLREGDVQVKDGELSILSYAERQSASKAELARDDRVRAALNQFTDEAILRPNAAMRPIWANDPHAMLLFHMKSFTYAFHERILKRVLSEAAEGNYMPLVRFLGYTPAMMAAIALQDAIQGDDDDKPFEEDLWNAAQRSGMPGAFQFLLDVQGDSQYGDFPGKSLLGPTAEHLIDWADAAFTDTTADSVAVRSLPLQNLWKGWLD